MAHQEPSNEGSHNNAPSLSLTQEASITSGVSNDAGGSLERLTQLNEFEGQREGAHGLPNDAGEDLVPVCQDSMPSSQESVGGGMTNHHKPEDLDVPWSPPLIVTSHTPSPRDSSINTAPDMTTPSPTFTTTSFFVAIKPIPAADFDPYPETRLSVHRRIYLRDSDSIDPIMSGGLGPTDHADIDLGGPDLFVYDGVNDGVSDGVYDAV